MLPMIMRRLPQWRIAPLVLVILVLQVGCQRQTLSPTRTPSFDQEHAYTLLKDLCSIGPRNHGSESKLKAEKWIQDQLREAGAEVSVHELTYQGKESQSSETFRNIIGRIRPSESRRVMVGTHYDTRAWADRDPRMELRSTPIIGANDGASGVAVMLEMAKAWKTDPPPVGVDLIFFDGEEFGRKNDVEDHLVGSNAWVRDHPEYKPEWGVVLDMVGDASLRIPQERVSAARACRAVKRIWQAAGRVGSTEFADGFYPHIWDDNLAFIDRGIPVALIIDPQYRWFHTTEDLPDKCSAQSLGQVGRAVMEAIYGD